MLRKSWVIARRELQSAFDSPVAYIVIVTFLLTAGSICFRVLFLTGRAEMRLFFEPMPTPLAVLLPPMLLTILAPAVTMRSFAEERRSGTLELMTTLPITDWHLVIGKFLGSFGIMVAALALTLAYPITISTLGALDWGPVIGGYLGLLLYAAALVAIGIMCSTFTNNQIVAFIMSFVLGVVLYTIGIAAVLLPAGLGSIVGYVSVTTHLENFARGLIDTRDVFYFLTITAFGLLLAERSLSRQHA